MSKFEVALPGLSAPSARVPFSKLIHEMRQPLSGIESIGYYLEMLLEDDDSALEQCGRLRYLVRQANWLLEDAALATHPEAPTGSVDDAGALNGEVFRVAENLALHDERTVRLNLAPGEALVAAGHSLLRRVIRHVLGFLYEVAAVGGEVSVSTERHGENWVLRMCGEPGEEFACESARLLTALRPGGLSGLMAGLGGSVSAIADCATLAVELVFPAFTDQAG